MAVNYDNFYLAPNLEDAYIAVIRGLADRYYESVTRYTTSSFLRLKLGSNLNHPPEHAEDPRHGVRRHVAALRCGTIGINA